MARICNSWLLLLGITALVALPAKAQVMYQATEKAMANETVFVTENRAEADLLVYVTEWRSDAKPDSGIWYWTKWRTDADRSIWFTRRRGEATLVIAYTPYQANAGRQTKSTK